MYLHSTEKHSVQHGLGIADLNEQYSNWVGFVLVLMDLFLESPLDISLSSYPFHIVSITVDL